MTQREEQDALDRLREELVRKHGLQWLHFKGGCEARAGDMKRCSTCGEESVRVGFTWMHPGTPLLTAWQLRRTLIEQFGWEYCERCNDLVPFDNHKRACRARE